MARGTRGDHDREIMIMHDGNLWRKHNARQDAVRARSRITGLRPDAPHFVSAGIIGACEQAHAALPTNKTHPRFRGAESACCPQEAK